MKAINWLIRFFKLFFDAVKACWDQLWKSFVMLVVLTVVLATIFYFYEAPLQEEYSNWWQDLRWAFFSYIGDPGGFGGEGPVTFGGRVIATLLSIVNILIFAVPAGIIASGFTTALEEDSKQKTIAGNLDKIRKSFTPTQCRHTYLRVMPTYKSLASLQVKHGLTENDIIEAVEFAGDDDLRLRNLADSYAPDTNVQDRLIVEMFPLVGNKDYGSYVDRGSNVTIVATSAHELEEIGSSRFGYLIAELGGFNFMSRDIDGSDFSYYILPNGVSCRTGEFVDPEGKLSEPFKHFFSDLKSLAEGKDHWVVLINQFARDLKAQLCFVTAVKSEEGLTDSTVIETSVLDKTIAQIKSAIEEHKYAVNGAEADFDDEHPLHVDLNTCFKPVGKRNLGVVLGGGVTTNVITLRMASALVVRDRRDVTVALTLAEIMRNNFCGADSYIADHTKNWKSLGIKY